MQPAGGSPRLLVVYVVDFEHVLVACCEHIEEVEEEGLVGDVAAFFQAELLVEEPQVLVFERGPVLAGELAELLQGDASPAFLVEHSEQASSRVADFEQDHLRPDSRVSETA